MDKLLAWFGQRNPTSSRRNLTMNYTSDAFSLPTHSPTFPPPSSPYSRTNLAHSGSYDPEPSSSSSFTYPPSAVDAYNNFPPSFNFNSIPTPSRDAPLLPTHSTPMPPPHFYPPLDASWNRINTWLSDVYPELADTLNWGITPQALQDIEHELGFRLPQAIRDSYLVVNGQESESLSGTSDGLFFGLTFLSLEDALEEWKFWRDVDDDPRTGGNPQLNDVMQSIPERYIRREYSNKGWFPLVSDRAGNYLGVDMNPDEKGTVGQVIVFGRDFDLKVVMHKGDAQAGWGRWIASFAEFLEAGEGFEVGEGDSSEDSEDGLGYESYFNDGSGRARGSGTTGGGSAGLRLTGEYKGWPVLEAWADQSFRHWKSAGLMGPKTPTIVTIPINEKLNPLPDANEHDVQEDSLLVISRSATPTLRSKDISDDPLKRSHSSRLPAPMPVDLPTPNDIVIPRTPSPPLTPDASRPSSLPIDEGENQHLQSYSRASMDSEPRGGNPVSAFEPSSIPLPQVEANELLVQGEVLDNPTVLEYASPNDPEVFSYGVQRDVMPSPVLELGVKISATPMTSTVLEDFTSGGSLQGLSTVRLVGVENAMQQGGDLNADHTEGPIVNGLVTTDGHPVETPANQHKKRKSTISVGLKKLGALGSTTSKRKGEP